MLRPRIRHRRWIGPVAVATVVLASTACTADPPPPIEQTEPTAAPAPAQKRNTVVVAIDGVETGFNPHLLADQSPVGDAIAQLVLPSAFRPAPSAEDPALTEWVLDDSVLVSAEVVSQAPFTIEYEVRTDAQWSDSAPIAAEDFHYLWQQMTSQPGVVDAAGYRLIEDVQSSGGGKTVTVTLREPYPAWRELFADMLPAHLVKDTPGGFDTGLSETIPVSGGPFKVESVDRGRGEVLLERNDRFWGEPALPDEILMRRGGSDAQLTESMRSGDTQIAQVSGGSALLAQLGAVSDLRTHVQLEARTLELTLNTRTPALADPRVRRGVLGLLDPEMLALVAAGSESEVVPDRAQVLAPSDPGYAPTMPPRPSREDALALLADSGYLPAAPDPGPTPESSSPGSSPPDDTTTPATTTTEESSSDEDSQERTPAGRAEPITDGTLVRDGVPLVLVLGVAEGSETAHTVARTVADVLSGAGIAATVSELPPDELYGDALVDGDVHAIVGWKQAGSDPATAALSRFGCPPALPDSSVSETPDTTGAAETQASPTSTSGATTTEDVPDSGAGNDGSGDQETGDETEEAAVAQLEAPSNLSGACDPEVQTQLVDAVHGVGDVPATLAAVEPRLWDLAVNLPIIQGRSVAAAGPGVDGVALAGPVSAGIVGDARFWWRNTQ
ncbi:ABC transporter family substrate-binding protein [Rhodococcus artemisiae]|uniref:ABC transporter family substrate-binding protein n=1 Tax=Rhodococcus artemisiae TaxID=714159 RepID=A0ABU7LHR9_9NOCA|nr:ABC transporter family substrate-binding protein [Rhodococcus artemisiae]MEE2061111.1 ABC transporter family substrate-binding protein [Rhodococcus artemisiae]